MVHTCHFPITLDCCHKHTHICSQTNQLQAQQEVVLCYWLLIRGQCSAM